LAWPPSPGAPVQTGQWLDRFTLRGRAKVIGQWTSYCLVHDIENLDHAAYAA